MVASGFSGYRAEYPPCWQLPTNSSSAVETNPLARYRITERIHCRTCGEEIAHPNGEQVRTRARLAPQSEGSNRPAYIVRSIVWDDREDVEVAVAPEVSSRAASKEPDLNRPHLELAQINEAAHFVR